MAFHPIAWVSKSKLTESHGTMTSRLISRIVNTRSVQQTVKRGLFGAWLANFSWVEKVLYKRNHDSTLLQCVDASEANHLMEEMHEGLHRAYANGLLLACKIMRAGYYWFTMENDCIKHMRICHHCQAYQDRKNAYPQPLHSLVAPWPFSA